MVHLDLTACRVENKKILEQKTKIIRQIYIILFSFTKTASTLAVCDDSAFGEGSTVACMVWKR